MHVGTLSNTLELIEYACSRIEKDPRCGQVAREIGHLAKSIRTGVDLVTEQLLYPMPIIIRMADGKTYVESEYVFKTLGLLLKVDDARQRVMMALEDARK